MAVQGACALPLGSEQRLCCLGQVLAELREVGWEELAVLCSPQGPKVLPCSRELCPGGILSPFQHGGSQEEMDALQESHGEISSVAEWLNRGADSPGWSPSLKVFKND